MISSSEAVDILSSSGCAPKVMDHCLAVSRLAVDIANDLLSFGKAIDIELVKVGAILHDLGRSRTHGIDHAVVGANMATDLGLDPRIVRIIRSHIGGGLSKDEAKTLGLPQDDYIPRTIEEKVVAHADNLTKGADHISLDMCLSLMEGKGLDDVCISRVKALADDLNVHYL